MSRSMLLHSAKVAEKAARMAIQSVVATLSAADEETSTDATSLAQLLEDKFHSWAADQELSELERDLVTTTFRLVLGRYLAARLVARERRGADHERAPLAEACCEEVGEDNSECSNSLQRVPLRPPGMAQIDEVTSSMRQRQRRDPTQWCLPYEALKMVLQTCVETPQYQELKRKQGTVTMYDVNDLFVQQWTKGTGCGVAVLMTRDDEQNAQLMLSHAWGEDVEEFLEGLHSWVETWNVTTAVPMWFCIFANYQCGDGEGPSIQEQVDMQPFSQVIEFEGVSGTAGGYGMVAIHTSTANLYSRLWCVHEVERAEAQDGVGVSAAMSSAYRSSVVKKVDVMLRCGAEPDDCLAAADVNVLTVKAQCLREEDHEMLVKQILSVEGGFSRLDRVIGQFRREALPEEVLARLALRGLPLHDCGKHSCSSLPLALVSIMSSPLKSLPVVNSKLFSHLALRLVVTYRVIPMCLVSALLNPASMDCHRIIVTFALLEEHAPGSVAVLAKELLDADVKVRCKVADALGNLGEHATGAVLELAKALLSDADVNVRSAAAEALSTLGEHAAGAALELLKALSDADVDARMRAADALGKLGEHAAGAMLQLGQALWDADVRVRCKAADALGRLGEHAVGAAPEPAKALANTPLSGEDVHVRSSSARALGNLREHATGAAQELAKALSDADAKVRQAAAEALSKLAEPAEGDAPELATAQLSDAAVGLRHTAADALGTLGDHAMGVPDLAKALSDLDEDVHTGATYALSKFDEHGLGSVTELSQELSDADVRVRCMAADSLGKLGEHAAGAVPELAKALSDADVKVRMRAADALGKLGEHAMGAIPMLAEQIGFMMPEAAEALLKICCTVASGLMVRCKAKMGCSEDDLLVLIDSLREEKCWSSAAELERLGWVDDSDSEGAPGAGAAGRGAAGGTAPGAGAAGAAATEGASG